MCSDLKTRHYFYLLISEGSMYFYSEAENDEIKPMTALLGYSFVFAIKVGGRQVIFTART